MERKNDIHDMEIKTVEKNEQKSWTMFQQFQVYVRIYA